jgi:hypothetical protein
MGKCTEDQIGGSTLPVDLIDGEKARQRIRRKLRKDVPHLLPGAALSREERNLGQGMPQQEPHELGAGVAGRAEDGDALFAVECHALVLAAAAAARESPLECRMSPGLARRSSF